MNGKILVTVFLVLAVALGAVDHCYEQKASDWEQRVRAAQAQVAVQQEMVDSLRREAAEQQSRAVAVADSAEGRRVENRETIERIRTEPQEHPIEVRDSLIDSLQQEADQWHAAYVAERSANEKLTRALQVTQTSLDSLSAVLKARPTGKPWYIPQVGIGPAVGICTGYKPCVAPVALTLSWKIKL